MFVTPTVLAGIQVVEDSYQFEGSFILLLCNIRITMSCGRFLPVCGKFYIIHLSRTKKSPFEKPAQVLECSLKHKITCQGDLNSADLRPFTSVVEGKAGADRERRKSPANHLKAMYFSI